MRSAPVIVYGKGVDDCLLLPQLDRSFCCLMKMSEADNEGEGDGWTEFQYVCILHVSYEEAPLPPF